MKLEQSDELVKDLIKQQQLSLCQKTLKKKSAL